MHCTSSELVRLFEGYEFVQESHDSDHATVQVAIALFPNSPPTLKGPSDCSKSAALSRSWRAVAWRRIRFRSVVFSIFLILARYHVSSMFIIRSTALDDYFFSLVSTHPVEIHVGATAPHPNSSTA
jgi:hypothetical protein